MGSQDQWPKDSEHQLGTEQNKAPEERQESEQLQQGKEIKESNQNEPMRRGGRTPAEPTIEEYPGGSFNVKDPETPLSVQKEVNGIKMDLRWDSGYGDYVLYFPNMRDSIDEDDEEKFELAGSAEVILISRSPQRAEQVLGYAGGVALLSKDPFEVSKKVQRFINQLPTDKLDE